MFLDFGNFRFVRNQNLSINRRSSLGFSRQLWNLSIKMSIYFDSAFRENSSTNTFFQNFAGNLLGNMKTSKTCAFIGDITSARFSKVQ